VLPIDVNLEPCVCVCVACVHLCGCFCLFGMPQIDPSPQGCLFSCYNSMVNLGTHPPFPSDVKNLKYPWLVE
jgi:hypothetical protein